MDIRREAWRSSGLTTQLLRELNCAHTNAMKQGLKALPQLMLGSATDQVVKAIFHRMLAVDRTRTHTQYTRYSRSCMLHTLRVEVIIGHLNPCITEVYLYIRCAHGRLYVDPPVPFEFARVSRVCLVGLAVEHRDG